MSKDLPHKIATRTFLVLTFFAVAFAAVVFILVL